MHVTAPDWTAFLGDVFFPGQTEYGHVRCLSSSVELLAIGKNGRTCEVFTVAGDMDEFTAWLRVFFGCNLTERDAVREGRATVAVNGAPVPLRALALPDDAWIVYRQAAISRLPPRCSVAVQANDRFTWPDNDGPFEPMDIVVSGSRLNCLDWTRDFLAGANARNLTVLGLSDAILPSAKWMSLLRGESPDDLAVARAVRRWFDVSLDYRIGETA